jgi:hypothetical protein
MEAWQAVAAHSLSRPGQSLCVVQTGPPPLPLDADEDEDEDEDEADEDADDEDADDDEDAPPPPSPPSPPEPEEAVDEAPPVLWGGSGSGDPQPPAAIPRPTTGSVNKNALRMKLLAERRYPRARPSERASRLYNNRPSLG